MSTNRLGAGTVNLCVNVRQPVHRALGRMAFAVDVSMGELVRRILARARILWRARARAKLAAEEDRMALLLLRRAGADGWSQEDQPVIERAMRLIADSERHDRTMARV
jgi:hypothetical protein